ncbi:hypothetical protein SSX86_016487 [Deinandra increscens subsp. villosa]|uniref:Uncharacterized protein n=1 Tax=Deinandra increscens subsp. villosa TaxID=3103831 RepID=A0AAP0C5F9_9ASTR
MFCSSRIWWLPTGPTAATTIAATAIGTKLSEDSRKYGAENTCTSGSALSKAAVGYSSARMDIERERENLLKSLGTQVVSMENLACSVIVYKDQTFVYVLYCCEFDINHDFIELLDVS